jgi:hypothetical protein
MTRDGVALHLQTQETENDGVLDTGQLGLERKLYYRELVARFAHALALTWDLGEENTNSPQMRLAFADHIHALDPWDHPVTVHPFPGQLDQFFGPLLGTHLEASVIQGAPADAATETRQLVDASILSGRPWAVHHVEQTPPDQGVVPDDVDFWHDPIRKLALWGNLIARGAGVEWYFGYAHPHNDLDCEDFRSRDHMWELTAIACDFFRYFVNFQDMEESWVPPSGPRVVWKEGLNYVVYLPDGGTTALDLRDNTEAFRVDWFDPRLGGPLQQGTVTQINGPGFASIGAPPPGGEDWVALVRAATNFAPDIEEMRVEPNPYNGSSRISVRVIARDPNGPDDLFDVIVHARNPSGVSIGSFRLVPRGGGFFTFDSTVTALDVGTWRLIAVVRDAAGAFGTASVNFLVD